MGKRVNFEENNKIIKLFTDVYQSDVNNEKKAEDYRKIVEKLLQFTLNMENSYYKKKEYLNVIKHHPEYSKKKIEAKFSIIWDFVNSWSHYREDELSDTVLKNNENKLKELVGIMLDMDISFDTIKVDEKNLDYEIGKLMKNSNNVTVDSVQREESIEIKLPEKLVLNKVEKINLPQSLESKPIEPKLMDIDNITVKQHIPESNIGDRISLFINAFKDALREMPDGKQLEARRNTRRSEMLALMEEIEKNLHPEKRIN
ncbi:MAG: hypothetical protein Q7T92_01080 [Lutibacter sp.]|nr:hypothetical protein [Lutibacter sp.]